MIENQSSVCEIIFVIENQELEVEIGDNQDIQCEIQFIIKNPDIEDEIGKIQDIHVKDGLKIRTSGVKLWIYH